MQWSCVFIFTWLLGGHDPDDGAVLVLGRHGDHDVDDADPRPRRHVLHHRRPHRGNPLAAFNNLWQINLLWGTTRGYGE